ncbi:MAG: protein translocase subunit SecF [Dehalococcoidia bacterium]
MKTIDLVSIRKWLFLGSGLTALFGLILLAIPPTLKPGIEFTSGSTMLIRFTNPVSQSDLRDEFTRLGHSEARIQSTGANEFLVRTKSLNVPAGSFNEVEPTATPTASATATATVGLGTVLIGKDGATGDIALRAVQGGDPCRLGIESGRVAANTQGTVLEQHTNCASGTVYRVEAGGATGYIQASDTHGFTPRATPTPLATATAAASATPGATQSAATPSASPAAGAPAATATPRPRAPGERGDIEDALQARFGDFEVPEFSSVSPVVSKLAVRNASIAVVVASIFILGYIAYAFSSVPKPFRYATCAIIATLHDVIIVLGAFSLFGKVFGLEVNLMFVTGLLTVIGFSVHDTIVVFDRIRENVRLAPNAPLEENVNAALVQTLGRSLNTSITVLLTVVTLLLLGGVTIQAFLLVLLVGVVSGVYSSVGIAAQLLVSWENGDFGRLLGRFRGRSEAPAS